MKRPSSQALEQQLLFQRQMQQSQLQSEQSTFEAQRASQQSLVKTGVAEEQAMMDRGIRKKIAKPVTLGTILTSPMGLLGNPMLSSTKLGG